MNLRLASTLAATLCIFCLASPTARSQSRHWKRTLRGECQAVAFNPRSNGRVLYTTGHDTIGIFRSDDGGDTWQQFTEGLEPFSTSNIRQLLVLPTDTAVVLAVSPRKLYRSTNGGRSWSTIQGLGGIQGEDIVYHDATDAIYYGQNFAGPTWKSLDHGSTWIQTGQASHSVGLCTLSVSPDSPPVLLAGSEEGSIVRSDDEGSVWNAVFGADTGTVLQPEVPKIVYSAFAKNGISHSIAFATRWLSTGRAVVKTVNNGETWSALDFPLITAWALDLDQRSNALVQETGDPSFPGPLRFWVGLFEDRSDTVQNGLIQETSDGGVSWHGTNFPLGIGGNEENPITQSVWVIKFDTSSGRLAAATSTGLYITATKAEVLRPTPVPPIATLALNGTVLTIQAGRQLMEIFAYDVLGKPCFSVGANDASARIDLTGLPAGIYFIRLEFEAGTNILRKLVLP